MLNINPILFFKDVLMYLRNKVLKNLLKVFRDYEVLMLGVLNNTLLVI